jgi:cytochrome P450
MNRTDIRDEIMTMFLAGFETSSVALTWTLYLISQHTEVRQRFLNELQQVIGEDKVRPEHIMQLSYTRQIIEEAMRLFPPVFTIPRQLINDMDMKGYKLSKGSLVLTSIYAIHRNPRYWEAPEQFNPDRFSPENADKIEKGAYMPFGLGQRMCIGNQFALLEMISALAVLGRRYELHPKEGYVPKMIPAITTNVSEGMPMYIRKVQSL